MYYANRRRILIKRMNQFKERTEHQRTFATLDVDEQAVMTLDINKMMKHIHKTWHTQRLNMAALQI